MTLYQVDYRTRAEGFKSSVHVLAASPYEAYRTVSGFTGHPIPTKVSLTNEADYEK